jgi:hypothetical protein
MGSITGMHKLMEELNNNWQNDPTLDQIQRARIYEFPDVNAVAAL